jgi:hypothetical protein
MDDERIDQLLTERGFDDFDLGEAFLRSHFALDTEQAAMQLGSLRTLRAAGVPIAQETVAAVRRWVDRILHELDD